MSIPKSIDPTASPTLVAAPLGNGAVDGAPGECVFGLFGASMFTVLSMTTRKQSRVADIRPHAIRHFASAGTANCCAVFLRAATRRGILGAVIHFNGDGEPGLFFRALLRSYGVGQAGEVQTCLVSGPGPFAAVSAKAAQRSLADEGFADPLRYENGGGAMMDAQGRLFPMATVV